jgi:dolichol-phosphate mannosyltransferase
MLADRSSAEDSVQEASITAWRKLRQLRGDVKSLRRWFLSIVANECRMARRQRWWSVVKAGRDPIMGIRSRRRRYVCGSTDIKTGYATLVEVRQVEAFEGVVQLGLGVDGAMYYRAFVLTNPTRLVIDIQAPSLRQDFPSPATTISAWMIEGLKVGVVIPAYNEAASLEKLLPRIPGDLCDLVIVVNDGSTDGTSEAARKLGATVIDRAQRGGPGPAIRDGLDLLRAKRFDIAAVMASNGKHDPAQLPDLIQPLADENLDLVRGSRHLEGGGHVNIPWHRLFMIQVFTVLFSILAGRRVTDATGGYQAYRLGILDDPRIDLHQPWLGRYEVETYLFAKTLLCGYRWKEIPIRITYKERGPYTRAAYRRLVGLLPPGAAAQARAEALTSSRTAPATRLTCWSIISGYMGSESTRLAAASDTGNEPGPNPAPR